MVEYNVGVNNFVVNGGIDIEMDSGIAIADYNGGISAAEQSGENLFKDPCNTVYIMEGMKTCANKKNEGNVNPFESEKILLEFMYWNVFSLALAIKEEGKHS
jgi:hypothetical protein